MRGILVAKGGEKIQTIFVKSPETIGVIFWSNHDPLKDFVYLGTVAILAQGKQSG